MSQETQNSINKQDVKDSDLENHEQFVDIGTLLGLERAYLQKRRANKSESTDLAKDSFGIALSGGGIRSATLCLGIIEELNKMNLLIKADYLSSVSGGGYLASYIHAARNKPEPLPYDQLFNEEKVIEHLRDSRMHLFIWPKNKFLSGLVLFLVAVLSFILNWLWIILPICFAVFNSAVSGLPFYGIMVLLTLIPAFLLSPNFTSLHRYYKSRLKKAYLWPAKDIKLKDLTNGNSPYPLINATVHVHKDDYDRTKSVNYRGKINTNYFLFSPLYCGSQVTQYANTSQSLYKNFPLSTAMATSGAAVNTFMGNVNLAAPIRWLMVLANLKTGLLAPSPFLTKWTPVFWPYYTLLEMIGKAKSRSYKIQVSDGGHIENLAIYELLRRQVKTIIAVDGGMDVNFDFFDLRNLIIRARNELGVVIEFDAKTDPFSEIKSDLITGASRNNFSVAKISGLKGSYAENYKGVLVYIKSSVLMPEEFKLRKLKNEAKTLKSENNMAAFEEKRRELDRIMYRTYTPKFPHETTADQFFSRVQWDAYHYLGKSIGESVLNQIGIQKNDARLELHEKCLNFIKP